MEWKIGTKLCATMSIFSQGTVTTKDYGCDFEPRTTNFSSTSLTLSEMKSFDDGEFSCTITLTNDELIEVTRFNVTVKGKGLHFNKQTLL